MWIPERVNRQGNKVPAFQVDECFADEARKHKWFRNSKTPFYVVRSILTNGKRSTVYLHRFIWECSGRETVDIVDHINGDTLDNRLENLRAGTHLLNMKNNRRKTQTKLGLPCGARLESKAIMPDVLFLTLASSPQTIVAARLPLATRPPVC